MKKILFLLVAVMLSNVSFSQEQDTTHFTIPMDYVIKFDSMNQKQLYSAFLSWVGKTYVSSNDVVQLKDVENGEVVIKYVTESLYTAANPLNPAYGYTHITMTFKCKDGKIKISYSNIYFEGTGDYHNYVRAYDQCRQNVLNEKIFWRQQLKYVVSVNASLINTIEKVTKYIQQYKNEQTDW